VNVKFSNLELILYSLGFAILLCALLGVSYYPPKDGGATLTGWLYTALGTLSGHMLGNVKGRGAADDAVAPPVPSAQAGVGLLPLLVLLVPIAFGLALSGCTTTTASMYSGLYTQAKAGVQVFDDNTLHTARDIICAQPYSAIQRNADLQAGIQVLCGPLANASSLDAGQLQLLMNVVGKAQAAGLLATPAAAAASGAK
jgi:hypothetical protein